MRIFQRQYRIIPIAALILLFLPLSVKGQTAVPLGGVGSLQFFDNSANLLTSGFVYLFQSGTSTPITVYTDSTATTTQPNPVPLAAGARASIWLPTGTTVKVVLCAANDGAACNGGDVIFSADNVLLTGAGGGAGGSCSSGCTGFFISSTASPATSGVLRCASGDSCVSFRNAAGSANIVLSKDVNDVLAWAGGDEKYAEINCPATAPATFDLICADVTAHRFKLAGNGGTMAQAVVSGVDINTSDQVSAIHFGASQETFGNTAPTSGQTLFFNGTNIVGQALEATLASPFLLGNNLCTTGSLFCSVYVLAGAHTLTRVVTNNAQASAGCSTNAKYGVEDLTSSTILGFVSPTSTGVLDSGALSVAMTAGHQFVIGVVASSVGCATQPQASVTATYF